MKTSYTKLWIWIGSVLLLMAGGAADQSLRQLQFDIVGIRLQVDPPVLTVPKDIPTQINTQLVAPTSSSADTTAALATLTAGTMVTAELRGPSIPRTTLTAKPGQPLPIPALALPADYFLDQIRLVKNGQVILEATPNAVPITVLSQILVASVTSQPLSLEQLRSKGLVIGDRNFQATNFQLAFNIDGKGTSFTLDLPVALPTRNFLAFHQSDPVAAVKQLTTINRTLAQAAVVTLPSGFDRPGLNFSVAALPFIQADTEDKGTDFGPPPITGLVVIPGNIAFLQQSFSQVRVYIFEGDGQ